MDTGSHLLFGLSLAGLAHLNPAVQGDAMLSGAIVCATMIGSHAPDFDAVYRLRGMDEYVKHHRGWSHSIPALFLWPAAVGALTAWGWGQGEHLVLLLLWSLISVVLHVALDLTNAYGVRCLLPFRREWLHLDSLCLTDPFLLLVHLIASAFWLTGLLWASEPGFLFVAAWSLSALYIVWRIVHHSLAVRLVKNAFPNWRAVHVLPDLRWFRWHYIVQTETDFCMGRLQGRRIERSAALPNQIDQSHDCVRASMSLSYVQVLLNFAKRAYVKWQKQPEGGYLVTWTDLRFWREKDWPFRVEVRMDEQLNLIEQKVGWHKKAWEPPYV
jgi:Predicted membrane-bound metal-dependent hydrolases